MYEVKNKGGNLIRLHGQIIREAIEFIRQARFP